MTFNEKGKAEEKDLGKDQESSFRHINFDAFEESKWKCERGSYLCFSGAQNKDLVWSISPQVIRGRWFGKRLKARRWQSEEKKSDKNRILRISNIS